MFAPFEELLRRRNQRFICVDSGWPTPGPERHTAYIEHDVGPPADEATLDAITGQIGDLPEIIEFYRRFGSARLYRDTVHAGPFGQACAYYIAPPDAWPELREDFGEWLVDLSDKERVELLPPWIEACIVIGEVPNSGNYFLVPLAGPERGRFFEFEHDGFEFIERGSTLADFLSSVSVVTDDLLAEIRVHTGYADGRTSTRWLCHQYVYEDQNG